MFILNKQIKENDKLVYIAAIIIILIIMLPISKYIDRQIRLTLVFVSMILFLLGLFTSNVAVMTRITILFLLLIVFGLLNYYGQWSYYISLLEKTYSFFLFWYPILIGFYISKTRNILLKHKIFRLIYSLFTLIAITTLIGLSIYPSAARDLASEVNTRDIYLLLNIGGYDFIYGLVFFFFIIKNYKTRFRITKLISLTLFIFVIIFSQYTTAILMFLLGLFLESFIKNKAKIRMIKIFSLIFIVFTVFILPHSFYLLLSSIMDRFSLNYVSTKIIDFSLSIHQFSIQGTLESRLVTFTNSLDAFLYSPLVGNIFKTGKTVGGHSEFFDILGSTGFIGISIILFSLIYYIKHLKSEIRENTYIIEFHLLLYLLIILSLVNTILNSPTISISVFLIPALIYTNTYNRKEVINK